MTDEPTLKQYNFLKGKGKYVEGMTKQQAHEAIALIIQAKTVPQTPIAQTEDAGAETVPMNLPDQTVVSKTNGWVDKPKKSYELTDGNIRIGALSCAIENDKGADHKRSPESFWLKVKEFEEYIRNGKE